jgi:hypothetical protein
MILSWAIFKWKNFSLAPLELPNIVMVAKPFDMRILIIRDSIYAWWLKHWGFLSVKFTWEHIILMGLVYILLACIFECHNQIEWRRWTLYSIAALTLIIFVFFEFIILLFKYIFLIIFWALIFSWIFVIRWLLIDLLKHPKRFFALIFRVINRLNMELFYFRWKAAVA